ncbi:hypothetical protein ABGB14_13570 [Nonomuraea sp. B10E15]|uniref:hypothetical protein n=1 Tax=Nonomuraea sp. B10E15 TaxID=3153560 RepID=UPI00325C5EDD
MSYGKKKATWMFRRLVSDSLDKSPRSTPDHGLTGLALRPFGGGCATHGSSSGDVVAR